MFIYSRLTSHVCRRAAREARRRRPQRVVGRRHQQLVAVVQQRVGRHHDQLAGPVAQIDVFQRHTLHTLLLGVVHDRLARRKNTFAVRIARRIGQVADHVLLDFFRCIEAERREVTDVQLDDLLAFVLHLPGRLDDRASHVVQHIGQLGGFLDGFQSPSGQVRQAGGAVAPTTGALYCAAPLGKLSI